MPTVELHVAAPGPTESTTASIEKAVARPGSPFQACPPGPQGQARTGTLEPAAGENLPPLSVRCWADVRTEAGFDVVGLNLVAPGDGPDYTIAEGKGLRPGEEVDLPGTGSFMAARWTFVVTDTYARPVYAKALTRTAGAGEFPHYEFRRDERRSLYNNVCSDGDGAPNTWRHVPTFAWPFELDWISACSE
ncbi:MAG: hypothetical protein QOH26_1551, partial [Actinomycetota bacterium]|nr:hypothetical protein [Actinomycetota bacterium]